MFRDSSLELRTPLSWLTSHVVTASAGFHPQLDATATIVADDLDAAIPAGHPQLVAVATIAATGRLLALANQIVNLFNIHPNHVVVTGFVEGCVGVVF